MRWGSVGTSGKPVPGTDLHDVDVLDRFRQATQGFQDLAVSIVAADVTSDNVRRR